MGEVCQQSGSLSHAIDLNHPSPLHHHFILTFNRRATPIKRGSNLPPQVTMVLRYEIYLKNLEIRENALNFELQ